MTTYVCTDCPAIYDEEELFLKPHREPHGEEWIETICPKCGVSDAVVEAKNAVKILQGDAVHAKEGHRREAAMECLMDVLEALEQQRVDAAVKRWRAA